MAKRLREYVNYTTKELNEYIEAEDSCVRKINTNLHLSMGPFCLADFKHVLLAHLVRSKVGFYDVHLDGIVLDVKNIKILGTTGAIRADDPRIHVNINADVYIFKPQEGAVLTGIVKHIGLHQVGVILYRVFNANLRVANKVDKNVIQMDQEVKFRICKYNLQNVFPYIDGELLTPGAEALAKGKKIVFKQEDTSDSGIEEKVGMQELDELLSVIKTEAPFEYEEALEECNNKEKTKKSKKSKNAKVILEDSAVSENPTESANKKSAKRRKPSVITEDAGTLTARSSMEMKSDECLPITPKKIKKEKEISSTKKHKSKSINSDHNVSIKEEFADDD